MSETDPQFGAFPLPEGHPERGPSEDLASLFEKEKDAGGGAMTFRLGEGDGAVSFALDGRLASAFRTIGEDPAELLRASMARLPDRDRLAAGLRGRSLTGVLLDRAFHLVEDHRRSGRFGLHRALFRVEDRILRRLLLQTVMSHALRHEGLPEGKDRSAEMEKALLKKDAGLCLLLFTEHKRTLFFLPRVLKTLDGLVDPRSGFREILVPILSRLPFVEEEDPAESPFGRPFLNGNVFDGLPIREKIRVVAGGVLAWYTTLSMGLLLPFRRCFEWITPYYGSARRILRHSFKEGFLLKKGFMSRAVKNLFRGNVFRAVEFFWSGWNPVLVRVSVRPMYRLLGGNRRPVSATVLTFLYTAWIVHLLWLAAAVLLGFRIAYEVDPSFRWGSAVGSDTNFAVLLCAVGAYVFFGFLSGLSKRMRSRKTRRLP